MIIIEYNSKEIYPSDEETLERYFNIEYMIDELTMKIDKLRNVPVISIERTDPETIDDYVEAMKDVIEEMNIIVKRAKSDIGI